MDIMNNLNIVPMNMRTQFRKTNKLWNECRFNSPYLIGPIMKLAKNSGAKNWIEFKEYYFVSGNKRDDYYLEDGINPTYILTKTGQLRFIKNNKEMKMGRSEQFINDLIKDWESCLKMNGFDVSYEFARISVYQRIFVDTMKGHEMETYICDLLNNIYKQFEFKKASPMIDESYNVDIECYYKNERVCGIQVKPISYLKGKKNQEGVKMAQTINDNKNDSYLCNFGASVFYVYYNINSANNTVDIKLQKKAFNETLKNFKISHEHKISKLNITIQ